MDDRPSQFRFSIGDLFKATLFAAASVAMFTLPWPDTGTFIPSVRIIAGISFGMAAIGLLFDKH
jgi:hypothetical protein